MLIARIEYDQVREYPLTIGQVKERFPGVSFPVPFEPPAGYEVVTPTEPPECQKHEKTSEVMPRLDSGQWFQAWIIEKKTEVELSGEVEYVSANIRNARNLLLLETDWTQGKDIDDSISDAWAPYRQALRDITKQSEFPFKVLWPQRPG